MQPQQQLLMAIVKITSTTHMWVGGRNGSKLIFKQGEILPEVQGGNQEFGNGRSDWQHLTLLCPPFC